MIVAEKGEFELIETLAAVCARRNREQLDSLGTRGFRLRLSIGDDAAAWDSAPGSTVFTTDTLVEGVHFDLGRIRWNDLGWKSVAASLSDVAAMGCVPTFSVVTLGLRPDLPVRGLEEMYEGMQDACARYGGAIVGGDVVRSPVFFITVSMQGATGCSTVLTRSGASPAEMVAVTGHLGASAGGLLVMRDASRRDSPAALSLVDAHNRPQPRVEMGAMLARAGATAAIDVSDGLVDDLGKLAKASGVDAAIRSDLVPIHPSLREIFPDRRLDLALSGGEDYELLFTASSETMVDIVARSEIPVTVIGGISEGVGLVTVIDSDGRVIVPRDRGWDHFASPAPSSRSTGED